MMCERYYMDGSMPEIHSILERIQNITGCGRRIRPGDKEPRQIVPALAGRAEDIRCIPALWGIQEHGPGRNGLIYNVWTEHVLHDKMLRRALIEHPVVLPATSFYEWKRVRRNIVEQYRCYDEKKSPVYLAGFYRTGQDASGNDIKMAALLTVIANKDMLPYQYRMPLLLKQNEVAAWLNGSYTEYFLNRVPPRVEIKLAAQEIGENRQ